MPQMQTIQRTIPLPILQRISNIDQTTVKDYVDAYDNFIWALAVKFTNSPEEAEAATREIFIDIWRFAEQSDSNQSAGNLLIGLIARRRLIKYLH